MPIMYMYVKLHMHIIHMYIKLHVDTGNVKRCCIDFESRNKGSTLSVGSAGGKGMCLAREAWVFVWVTDCDIHILVESAERS